METKNDIRIGVIGLGYVGLSLSSYIETDILIIDVLENIGKNSDLL